MSQTRGNGPNSICITMTIGLVLFSLMKKIWNFDVPDEFLFYWRNVRENSKSILKRQQRDDSFMVWNNGKTYFCFLNGRQNSQKNKETVDEHLFPFGEHLGGPN